MAAKTTLTTVFNGETKSFFQSLSKVEVGIGGVVTAVAGIGAAVAGVSVGMAKIWANTVRGAANSADEIGKMAARTGISTEALQKLQLGAGLAGVELGSVEKAARRMGGTILDLENGLSTPTRAFDKLGLSLEDVKGKTPDKQLETLMGALAGVEDASTRAALAEDIFGRSGTALLPMVEKGAKGFRDLMKEREKLGDFMTEDQIDKAEEFNDSILRMKTAVKAISFQAVADSFGPLAEQFNEFAQGGGLQSALPALKSLSDMFRDLATMSLDILQSESTIRGVQLAADSIGAAAQAVSELTGADPVEQAGGRAAIEREGATIWSQLPAAILEHLTPKFGAQTFAGMGSQEMLAAMRSIDSKMPAAQPGVAY